MLAMLFEMSWTLSPWAAIPEAAMSSARMMISPYMASGRNRGELVERGGALGVLLLQQAGDRFIAAGDLDHARHLGDRAHVRLLDRALHDPYVRWCRLGSDAGGCREQARSLLLQRSRIGELGELQLTAGGIG